MPICETAHAIIFFAHIPKTGGSSVEAYLERKGTLLLHGAPRADGVHPQHWHRAWIDGMYPVGCFDVSFAVLRDPVDRMVSEWLWRSTPLNRVQRLTRAGRRDGARRIKLDGTKRSLTFDTWVPEALDLVARRPEVQDNHLRPQVDFVSPADRLFAYESGLEPVYRWIDGVTDGRVAASSAWLKKSRAEKPRVGAEARALIEAFYAEDLELHRRVLADG